MTESFTLVFKGDLRKISPFSTETPYGLPYYAAMGDMISRHDVLRRALNEIVAVPDLVSGTARAMQSIARKALDEVKS